MSIKMNLKKNDELAYALNFTIRVVAFIITQLFFGTFRRMWMTVTTFNDSNHFLDEQEHQYAGQDPQTYSDLVVMVVSGFARWRFDAAILAVVVMMIMVFVRKQRVRDQVQERVAQQSARRETQ